MDNSGGMVDWGTSVASYIAFVEGTSSIRYFHNLKFDGRFIVDYLLKQGYTHVFGDKRDMRPRTFTTLFSDMGKWYSFTVKWENGTKTEFRDSVSKLPMTVERIGQSFNLGDEGLAKKTIDYHKFRPVGYQPTAEELDYLENDVRIVAAALKQVLDKGMTRLTVASDSLAEYKKLFGLDLFKVTFPVLAPEVDNDIRRAYRGGFTYADKRHRGKLQGRGIVLDVNSLYPAVMYNEMLPYGEPEFFEGAPEPTDRKPLCIFGVTFTARIKPNHIPVIQMKGSARFVGTEYLDVIDEPIDMMVTDVDWKLFNDHYDIDVIAYHGGYRFAAVTGLFKDYIDKWSEIKANSKGGTREIAKLHLNSLYGKFATNPLVSGKYPVLDDDVVKMKRGPDEFIDPVYTAVGVFVTSYARNLTIRAAQDNYDTFYYADTDSLHLAFNRDWTGIYTDPYTGEEHMVPGGLDVHPSRMGAWKFEYAFQAGKYFRAKAYLEQKPNGEYVAAWAGLPASVQQTLTFDNAYEGRVIREGKLQPQTVPGGVVLMDVPYTL